MPESGILCMNCIKNILRMGISGEGRSIKGIYLTQCCLYGADLFVRSCEPIGSVETF